MCWGCKATCNNCKPAEQLYVSCPECGLPNAFTREQFLMFFNLPHRISASEEKMRAEWDGRAPVCKKCGADMADALHDAVVPEPCIQSRIICGYPCGQRKVALPKGRKPCSKMVPVGRYRGGLNES